MSELSDSVREYLAVKYRTLDSFRRPDELVSEAIQPLWEERRKAAVKRAEEALEAAARRADAAMDEAKAHAARVEANQQREVKRRYALARGRVEAEVIALRGRVGSLELALGQYADHGNWLSLTSDPDHCVFMPCGNGWEIAERAMGPSASQATNATEPGQKAHEKQT